MTKISYDHHIWCMPVKRFFFFFFLYFFIPSFPVLLFTPSPPPPPTLYLSHCHCLSLFVGNHRVLKDLEEMRVPPDLAERRWDILHWTVFTRQIKSTLLLNHHVFLFSHTSIILNSDLCHRERRARTEYRARTELTVPRSVHVFSCQIQLCKSIRNQTNWLALTPMLTTDHWSHP